MSYLIRTKDGDIGTVEAPERDEARDAAGVVTHVWATIAPEATQRRVPAEDFTRLARTAEEHAANPGSELY